MHDSNLPSKPPSAIKALVKRLADAAGTTRVRVAALAGGNFHVSLPGYESRIVKADGTLHPVQVARDDPA